MQPPPAASAPSIVNAAATPVRGTLRVPPPRQSPIIEIAKKPEPEPVAHESPPLLSAVNPRRASAWQAAVKPAPEPKRDWRFVAGFVLAGLGVVILVTWTWQSFFSEPAVQRVAATSSATPSAQPAAAGRATRPCRAHRNHCAPRRPRAGASTCRLRSSPGSLCATPPEHPCSRVYSMLATRRASTCLTAPPCVSVMPRDSRFLSTATRSAPSGPTAKSAKWFSRTARIRS